MTLLLTNDDGIDAPGIAALGQSLDQMGRPNWVKVAPVGQWSGCSHQVTRGGPLVIERRSPQAIAIHGTPADCTRVGLAHLLPDTSMVLSGINAGGNMGADIYASGTVAAVREAVLHRVPGIAISRYIHKGAPIDWAIVARHTAKVLEKLLAQPMVAGMFWNINLPHCTAADPEPQIIECPLCTQPLPLEHQVSGDQFTFTGRYEERSRDPGSDLSVCLAGNIAVTSIRLW
ncbi:MAG: 5'/3'-nucleotidase SurE [Leptolyngbyaceae bacterium]|nr:5'/3'-nucleotidase SurE [Leptolyngbyaceae bacterium]